MNIKNIKFAGFVCIIALILFGLLTLYFNNAIISRELKTKSSNFWGGLNRKATLYSNDGKLIKTWEGKMDLTNSEHEIQFDLNNKKRIIIHGGIVVVEEQ